MLNLILQSYGRENEYRRAILTVLSYYAWLKPEQAAGRTILFTDNSAYFSAYFAGLPVEYVPLTPEKIRELMGPANFIHRLKAAIIDEAFQMYPGDDLFYADSDTFFFTDPTPRLRHISPIGSLMHVQEYALETRRHEKMGAALLTLLDEHTFTTSHGAERFGGAHYSWNAGVMGLPAVVAGFMPDVLQLTDEFFAASGWHISEQLAFSLILQTRTQVQSCHDIIFHYWQGTQKTAVDALLPGIFTSTFQQLPLDAKCEAISVLTSTLPAQIAAYIKAHPEILLKELHAQAIYSFQIHDYAAGYRFGWRYLVRNPTDLSFIKDILYYSRQRLFS